MATIFVELSAVRALRGDGMSIPSSHHQIRRTQSIWFLEDSLVSNAEGMLAKNLPSLRSKVEMDVLNPSLWVS